MKKTIVLVTAIAALIFTSCSKKKMSAPINEDASSVNSTSQNFKYSENIRVYDDSKTFYMDITLSSINEEEFKMGLASLKNSKITLLSGLPKARNNNEAFKKPESENYGTVKPLITTQIVINKIYKGKALGMQLTSSVSILSRTNTYYWGRGYINVQMPACNYYGVYPYNAVTVNDYWGDGSNWYWVQQAIINPGSWWYAGGISGVPRMAIITGSQTGISVDLVVF